MKQSLINTVVITIVFATFISAVGIVSANNSDRIALKKLLDNYLMADSISGSFYQRNDTGNTQRVSGTFFYQKPFGIRWQYHDPDPILIIGNGTTIWIYDKSFNQVIVQDFNVETLGPSAILTDNTDALDEKYSQITEIQNNTHKDQHIGIKRFELVPKDQNSLYYSLKISFNHQKVLQDLSWTDVTGVTHIITFGNVKINQPTNQELFNFTVRADMEIIDQRAKGTRENRGNKGFSK